MQLIKSEEPKVQSADEDEDFGDTDLDKADPVHVSAKAEDSDDEDFKIEEI